MMIGGGGESCSRADHGIGITETNEASFVDLRGGDTEYDFGYNAQTSNAPTQSYSLNLWIRYELQVPPFLLFPLRKTDERWDTIIPKGHKKKYDDFI